MLVLAGGFTCKSESTPQVGRIDTSNPDGVNLGYRYDALNRLAYVDDGTTGTVQTSSYSYNANGSQETMSAANGVTHQYAYDALNRLRDLEVRHLASVLRHQEYQLRASGHRQQILEGAKTTTYGYDELYRLTGETIVNDPHGNSGVISYDLDKVGNRLNRAVSGPHPGRIRPGENAASPSENRAPNAPTDENAHLDARAKSNAA